MSKSTKAPTRETKTAILRKLLSRKTGADLAALQGNHEPEFFLGDQLTGFMAEFSGENPVERCGGAASL